MLESVSNLNGEPTDLCTLPCSIRPNILLSHPPAPHAAWRGVMGCGLRSSGLLARVRLLTGLKQEIEFLLPLTGHGDCFVVIFSLMRSRG